MKTFTFLTAFCLAILMTACSKKTDDTTTTTPCTWTTLFFDNFQRANGPLGTNWADAISFPPAPHNCGSGFFDILDSSMRVSTENAYWAAWYTGAITGNKTRVSVKCFIPDSVGQRDFGVGGKATNPGTMNQICYFAAVAYDTLTIFKVNGTTSQYYTKQYAPLIKNHEYRITLTMDLGALTATLEDLTSSQSTTVTATDTGTPLSGTGYSINGNTVEDKYVLFFHDFLVESCQ